MPCFKRLRTRKQRLKVPQMPTDASNWWAAGLGSVINAVGRSPFLTLRHTGAVGLGVLLCCSCRFLLPDPFLHNVLLGEVLAAPWAGADLLGLLRWPERGPPALLPICHAYTLLAVVRIVELHPAAGI